MKIEYHPAVVDEFNNAVQYYNQQRAGLGREFRAEVFRAIDLILQSPQRCKTNAQGNRARIDRRFPYSIVFRLTDRNTVRVLILRHHRRHADLGATRR